MVDALLYGMVSANVVLGWSFVAALRRQGAPFVPTAARKLRALFGDSGLLTHHSAVLKHVGKPVDAMHLVDLGSGDGSVLRAARQAGFGRATGYEINPFLCAVSLARSAGAERESVRWQSLWTADMSDADIVVVYGVPPIMERLGRKLRAELPPRSIVVSNAYAMPILGQPLLEPHVTTSVLSPDVSSKIYVYALSSADGGPAEPRSGTA